MSSQALPVIFLSHGAGPSFHLSTKDSPRWKGVDKDSNSAKYLQTMVKQENLPRPKAILVLSAHWEEDIPTVQTGSNPDLYYDYSNFPPETYKLKWPAPGAPDVAMRTKKLLEEKGFHCDTDSSRGFDHGVFIPLMLAYPKADIPVFQLSILSSMDMAKHLDLGEALSDLRHEGVLIVGSGFTTHGKSMTGDPGEPAEWVLTYQDWLHDILLNMEDSREDKRKKLISCSSAPGFNIVHPRLDHFLPIAMTLAAAGYTKAKISFSEFISRGGIFGCYIFNDV